MLKKTLIAICTLTYVLGFTQTARACFCGVTTVEAAFGGADVVFVGKIIKITSVKEASVGVVVKEAGTLELLKVPRWEKSVYKARSVTLEVVEGFKGVTTKTVDVLTYIYDGGGTCGVNFRLGESYLVYAHKRESSLSDDESKYQKRVGRKKFA